MNKVWKTIPSYPDFEASNCGKIREISTKRLPNIHYSEGGVKMMNKPGTINHAFIQGYACAISCIIKGHGADTATDEALVACGLLSVKILRRSKVEEYDIEILKPSIKSLQRRIKRNRSTTTAEPKGVK